jgi:hypothetical protein
MRELVMFLDMIWKRLEDLQAETEAIRGDLAELREELAGTNEKMQRSCLQ